MATPFAQVEEMFFPKFDWAELANLLDSCGADGKIESILECLTQIHPIEEWQAQHIGERSEQEYKQALEERVKEREGLIRLAGALRRSVHKKSNPEEANVLVAYWIGYAHAQAQMRAAAQAIWAGGRILQSQRTKKKKPNQSTDQRAECERALAKFTEEGRKKTQAVKLAHESLDISRSVFYERLKG